MTDRIYQPLSADAKKRSLQYLKKELASGRVKESQAENSSPNQPMSRRKDLKKN